MLEHSESSFVPLRPKTKIKPSVEYYGSVIVLYRAEDEIPISVSTLGLDWALGQLESFTTKPDGRPASDIKKFESAILADLDAFRGQTYKSGSEKAAKLEYAICFIGYAVLKENSELWNETFPHLVSADPMILECTIIEAFEVFDFSSIQPG